MCTYFFLVDLEKKILANLNFFIEPPSAFEAESFVSWMINIKLVSFDFNVLKCMFVIFAH